MSGAHAREHGELLSQKQMLLIPTQKPPHSPALPDIARQMATAESTAEKTFTVGTKYTSVGLVKDQRWYSRASNTHKQYKCLGCARDCAKHLADVNLHNILRWMV